MPQDPFVEKDAATTSAGVVDVIMAAYNRETTVERAIESALADPAVRRVIVVDDASSDQTAKAAEAADDGSGRLIVERFSVNRGPAAARNAALSLSTSPFVAVVDADDYVLPGRFTSLLGFADGYDFVADDMLQIPEGRIGLDEPAAFMSRTPFEPWECTFTAFVLGNVSKPGKPRKELGFFKPLMRRAFLEARALRYDERLRLGEDYALYARALALGARFLVVPAQGYVSVVRDQSLSARHSRQDLERLRDSDLSLMATRAFTPEEMKAIRKHYWSLDARVQWLEVIEAVKARKPWRVGLAFTRSAEVSRSLSARLLEQLLLRSKKRLRRPFYQPQ